ncbi:MAG: hypothetical protein PUI31_03205, partial [Clostridia bacterium]|nr:hypothetical protein [Clostridia bacterium]
LDNMCATLEISKRTYYKYRNAEDKDYYDYLLIKEIFDESKKTYGYRNQLKWIFQRLISRILSKRIHIA